MTQQTTEPCGWDDCKQPGYCDGRHCNEAGGAIRLRPDEQGLARKPCPFCGKTDLWCGSDESKEEYPTRWYVYCGDCEARGPEVGVVRDEHGSDPKIRAKYEAAAWAKWEGRA